MRYQKRMNRYEKREMNHEKLTKALHGEGIYVFRNNTNADFGLPKPSLSGSRTIGRGQEFQGDSYFLNYVGMGLSLVRTIVAAGTPPETTEAVEPFEVIMESQKLILDQPDTITIGGKVEHVVETPNVVRKQIKEQKKHQEDTLLLEDPLDGVEILTD